VQLLPLEQPPLAATGELPKLKLFIGITTAYRNEPLRDAVRNSWLRYHSLWDNQWAYRFFLGETNEPDLYAAAVAEQSKNQDIVFLPFLDTYNNLSRKTMWLSGWAVDHYDFTFLLKIDDDTFLRLDRYVGLLQGKPTEGFYYGMAEGGYSPARDGKWAVPESEFPSGKVGPPWQHGFIYTMSRDCAIWLKEALPEPRIHLEDINTAIILADHHVAVPGMPGIMGSGCSEGMIASHYSGGDSMLNWYHNSVTGSTICSATPWP